MLNDAWRRTRVLDGRATHHRDKLDLADPDPFGGSESLRTDDQAYAETNKSDWITHGKPPMDVISKS